MRKFKLSNNLGDGCEGNDYLKRMKAHEQSAFEDIRQTIIADPGNHAYTSRGIGPLFKASKEARIALVGQSPGRKAEESGLYWNDLSGERLREWLGISREGFYESDRIAQIPMDFYFPGKGKSWDLPPRKGIVEQWHPRILAEMPRLEMMILFQEAHSNRPCSRISGPSCDPVRFLLQSA